MESKHAQLKRIFDSNKKLLTCAELSEKVGLTEKAIRRRVERGVLPTVPFGGSVRFDLEEVVEWLAKRKGAKNVS